MAGHLLYSTNPFFAYEVARTYLSGKQTVYCCDFFDPASIFAEARVSMVGPSSSPKAIADQLLRDVEYEDAHSALIGHYRSLFGKLAEEWARKRVITREQAREIGELAEQPTFKKWRPLVYLIPRASVEQTDRLQLVPANQRAAHGAEYEITDLELAECDIIEWTGVRP